MSPLPPEYLQATLKQARTNAHHCLHSASGMLTDFVSTCIMHPPAHWCLELSSDGTIAVGGSLLGQGAVSDQVR